MRFLTFLLCLVLPASAQLASHPRIWLTSDLITTVVAKKNAGDADWISLLARADYYLPLTMPTLTIVSATNANPVEFTVSETALPWTGSGMEVGIGGATGGWTGVNSNPALFHALTATITGTNKFTLPVNSTSFGSFTGQVLTVWIGGAAGPIPKTGWIDLWTYRGDNVYIAAFVLGLVYKVKKTDGDADWATYEAKAEAIYDYLANAGAAGIANVVEPGNCYAARNYMPALAMLQDWLYSELDSTQKARGAAAQYLWYGYAKNGYVAYPSGKPTNRVTSNFWGGELLGVGLAGYASYDEDNVKGQEMIDWARLQWTTNLVPHMVDPSGLMSGGFHWETSQYGTSHLTRVMLYALAVKTAEDDTILTAEYAKAWANNLLHLRKPDKWGTTQEGTNSATTSIGVLERNEAILLSHVLSGTVEGEYIQYALGDWVSPPSGLLETAFNYLNRALFYNSAHTATSYTSLPLYKYVPGANLLIQRSGWATGSNWISFHGGTNNASYDHTARLAGHVEIDRGVDRLIINAHNQALAAFDSRSAGSSTLYWDDGTQPAGYIGGQRWWGAYTVANYRMTDDFVYAQANETEAYENNSPTGRNLRYFIRDFVSVNDGTVVVLDRVLKRLNSYTAYLRWHFGGTPSSVATNTYKATVGTSAIYSKTILPTSPTFTLTANGGTGGTYRLDVADPATSTTYTGLTVLFAGASAASLPTTTQLTTINTNFVGVQIADSTPKVVVLAIPVTDNGNNTYTPSLQTSSSFTSTHSGTGRYVLCGMGVSSYDITLNAAPFLTGQVVGSDSCTTWTGTAGAYQVGSAPNAIVLSAIPATLSFTCNQGGSNPNAQTITVSATGGTLDQWTASKTQSWLSLSPTSGVASGNFDATANCTGLLSGTYTDTISVSSSTTDVVNSPQSVGVELTVSAAVPVTIIDTSLEIGYLGIPYSFGLSVTGGTPPYTWSLTTPSTCGISITAGGVLTGTPTVVGNCALAIRVTDAVVATANVALDVNIALGPLGIRSGSSGLMFTGGATLQ